MTPLNLQNTVLPLLLPSHSAKLCMGVFLCLKQYVGPFVPGALLNNLYHTNKKYDSNGAKVFFIP